MAVNITFLKDGEAGQPVNIANQLAQFINEAQSSLHIAIYDFRLKAPEVAEPVRNPTDESGGLKKP